MFFSVKRPMKILGKTYVPCICYEVTKVMEATVNKLVDEEKAVTYGTEVGFMNGKVLVKAKKPSKKSAKKEEKEEAVIEEKAEITLEESSETEGF